MSNYLLFKQLFCLVLFFESIILLPSFYRYFGPPSFPKSLLKTPFIALVFNLFLMSNLILLFFDIYPLISSFFILICMRYMYATELSDRLLSAGAVGYISYFVPTYVCIFELGYTLDPSYQLNNFFHTILAYEIGIMMIMAAVYKAFFGYFRGEGIEYALANPLWGKFSFIFKNMSPYSWFFKLHNIAVCVLELFCGLCFFVKPIFFLGAYTLVSIFLCVFLTLRVSVLSLLMMVMSLLFIPSLSYNFPTLNYHLPSFVVNPIVIKGVEIAFIVYLIIYICASFFLISNRLLSIKWPNFIAKPLQAMIYYRPVFEWIVFTSQLTHFFVTIETISKSTGKIQSIVFDGFTHHYLEVFINPKLFFRFIHHHESSILLTIFYNMRDKKRRMDQRFHKMVIMYAKTILPKSERTETAVKFTIIHLEKTSSHFQYAPFNSYVIDLESNRVVEMRKI